MPDANDNREDAVDADSETQVVPAQQPAWAPPPASSNAYFDDQRTVYQRMTHEAQTSPEDDADDVFSTPLVSDDDQATQLVDLPRAGNKPEDAYIGDVTDDQTTQLTPDEWGTLAKGASQAETYGPPGTALSDLHDEGLNTTMHGNQTFASFPPQEEEQDAQETTMLPANSPEDHFDDAQATTMLPSGTDEPPTTSSGQTTESADATSTEQPILTQQGTEPQPPPAVGVDGDAPTAGITPEYVQQYAEAPEQAIPHEEDTGYRHDQGQPGHLGEQPTYQTPENYGQPAGWDDQATYMTPQYSEQQYTEPPGYEPETQQKYVAEPPSSYQPEPPQGYQPEGSAYQPEQGERYLPEPEPGYQPDPGQASQQPLGQGYPPDAVQGYQYEAGQGYQPEQQQAYQQPGSGYSAFPAGYSQQSPFDPTHGAAAQGHETPQPTEQPAGYQTGPHGYGETPPGYAEQPSGYLGQQYPLGQQYGPQGPPRQADFSVAQPPQESSLPMTAPPAEFERGSHQPSSTGGGQLSVPGQNSSYMVPQNIPGRFVPTAEEFAARRAHKPQTPEATMGLPGLVKRLTFGIFAPPMSKREEEHREYVAKVRRNFGGLRQITVVNPKGGAGKTVASLMTAMTFGQNRGGYVLAWDNNETQGTLGMRAQPDFHAHTVRDVLQSLDTFLGPGGKVGDLSSFVRSQGEAMFDVLASDESATAGEMLTASAFKQIREVVSRFYKLIIVDTGNNVRAENWQAAIDQTDQLMVTMSARGDSAETAARMLDHLEQTGRSSLVRHAVTVVSMPPSRRGLDLPAIERHFSARTRSVLIAPYEPIIDSGEPIRYENISNASREAWLRIASGVAEGL